MTSALLPGPEAKPAPDRLARFRSGRICIAFWTGCPSANERPARIAGLDPDTGQGNYAANRKRENDVGHDVLLPAQGVMQAGAPMDGPRRKRQFARL
jgi:hypothetical protein